MAEYQQIEYRIGTDGRVIETVIGASGHGCTETTAVFETALGNIEKRELLPEYAEEEENWQVESVQQAIE